MSIGQIFHLMLLFANSISHPIPQQSIPPNSIVPLPHLNSETRESISQLANLYLETATDAIVKSEPSLAHAIFLRMDDFSLIPEMINFTQCSLSLLTTSLGPYDPETLNMEHDMGVSYMKNGDYEEALTRLIYLAAKEDRILGHEHPYTLRTAYKISLCLFFLNRYEESLIWSKVTLESELQMSGGNETEETSRLRIAMVYAYYGLGQLDKAIALNEQVVQWTTPQLKGGQFNKFFIVPKNNRAYFYALEGKWRDAKAEYEDLLELCRVNLGEEDEYTLTAKMGLAQSMWNLGEKRKKAIWIGDEVIEARSRIGGALNQVLLEKAEEKVASWRKEISNTELEEIDE